MLKSEYRDLKVSEEVFSVGDKFGDLTIIDMHQISKYRKSYNCLCSCGNTKIIGHSRLTPKHNRRPDTSCGCNNHAHDGLVMKHKRVYGTWYLMNKRCTNPKADNYERYGGKGVYVVGEWKDNFESFLEWSLNNGYAEKLTIDRIDSKKPYSPDNCRWVDYYIQNQNKGIMKNNKTGVTGVSKYKYGYKAEIRRNELSVNLGTHKTISEAKNARMKGEEYFREHKTLIGYK